MKASLNETAPLCRESLRSSEGCEELIRLLESGLSDENRLLHLGIMGGTFDPIHLGHLACAEMARDACSLDGVIFLPAGSPNFKQGLRIACAQDRVNMCRIAIEGNPAFAVSSFEVERDGVTYTVDSLEILRARFGENVRFSFIIGADSLLSLAEWKDANRLAKLTDFICVARPGYVCDSALIKELESIGFSIRMVQAPLLEISSSNIRQRVSAGQTIKYLTPLKVCDYIMSNGLYREECKGESDKRRCPVK